LYDNFSLNESHNCWITTIHKAVVIDAGVYTAMLVSIEKSSSDEENSYNKALIVAVRLSNKVKTLIRPGS